MSNKNLRQIKGEEAFDSSGIAFNLFWTQGSTKDVEGHAANLEEGGDVPGDEVESPGVDLKWGCSANSPSGAVL